MFGIHSKLFVLAGAYYFPLIPALLTLLYDLAHLFFPIISSLLSTHRVAQEIQHDALPIREKVLNI